jgi:hypothetical protein
MLPCNWRDFLTVRREYAAIINSTALAAAAPHPWDVSAG